MQTGRDFRMKGPLLGAEAGVIAPGLEKGRQHAGLLGVQFGHFSGLCPLDRVESLDEKFFIHGLAPNALCPIGQVHMR